MIVRRYNGENLSITIDLEGNILSCFYSMNNLDACEDLTKEERDQILKLAKVAPIVYD
jgi:hypothetical protein